MRTLIFLAICAVCVGIAIAECRDRENRQKLVIHILLGLLFAYGIWWVLVQVVHAFDSYAK